MYCLALKTYSVYVPLKLQKKLFAPSNLGIFNCESCDYSCENKQTFDNHVTRTHNPKNVVVKKRVWKKRIKGHFKCAHCTWTGSGLSKHWKSEHPEQPLPFLCHLCDHRYGNMGCRVFKREYKIGKIIA